MDRGHERRNFQVELEKEFELSNHPKAQTLFDLAWDYGHSSGLHEVRNYYIELKDLLQS